MTVVWRGSVCWQRPRRNRAPPTPPASTVTRNGSPRVPHHPSVECRPLDRDATHRTDQRLDFLDRGVLARIRARLARDALLHERATEVVAAGAERQLRKPVAVLHPRGLQVVDHATQQESAGGEDAEIAETLRLRAHGTDVEELTVQRDNAERDEIFKHARYLMEAAEKRDEA